MARYPGCESIYDAAETWRHNCLVGDRSVFTDRQLWIATHVEELIEFFVKKPDLSARDFETKLRDQISPASAAAKQLAAEMLWVMALFPSATGQARKASQIRTAWDWSGEDLPADHPLLGEPLRSGIGHVGTAFNTLKWKELAFLIRIAARFKMLSADERIDLTSNPWRFSEWLASVEEGDRRQLRHVLLHLLYPDSFERIASAGARAQLREAFAGLPSTEEGVESAEPMTSVDQQILKIRGKLELELPGQRVDFYEEPVRSRWLESESAPELQPPVVYPRRTNVSRVIREPSEPRIWAIGAGDGASRWPSFHEQGVVAIGWEEIGDLRQYENRDALQAAIKVAYGREKDPIIDSLACWQFCHEIRVGDQILVKQGRDRVLGYGLVESAYEYDESVREFNSLRKVRWVSRGNWPLPEGNLLPIKTLTEVSRYTSFVEYILPIVEATKTVEDEPYSIDNALENLFLSRTAFAGLIASTRRRKNLILQGPPGVGKSFLARKLAYALIGAQKADQFQMVQFHQSYAYEDFIQGWRPNGSGGFGLRNGVFYEFCRRAQSHPDRTYVFVIDEINRGNLSKVFGELFFLLEADKRGPDFAIPLTYSESGTDTFHVPENVFVIGLMNTADRSLAMVDYALRRRFAFATLKPEFASEKFRSSLLEKGVSSDVVDAIIERVGAVNRAIVEDDKTLGAGFVIGHSYFCPREVVANAEEWYESIVQQELHPLLEEYWFDSPERVSQCMDMLLG